MKLETSFSFASVGGSPAMVAESALQDPSVVGGVRFGELGGLGMGGGGTMAG
jgi:hypothetical protein